MYILKHVLLIYFTFSSFLFSNLIKNQIISEMSQIPLYLYNSNLMVQESLDEKDNLIEIINNKLFYNGFESIDEQENICFTLNHLSLKNLLDVVLKDIYIDYLCIKFEQTEEFLHNWYNFHNGKKLDFPCLITCKAKKRLHNIFVFSYPGMINVAEWDHKNTIDKTISLIGKVPWEQKKNILFWRGEISDCHKAKNIYVPELFEKEELLSPRMIFILYSFKYPSLIDIQFTRDRAYEENENFLEYIEKYSIPWFPRIDLDEHVKYKYQLVIDGSWCTMPGYAWRLVSDCCVFKVDSTIVEWFDVGLIPWVHYIPVKTDASDLLEKIQWALDNDEKAKEIAENGSLFGRNCLKFEDYIHHAQAVLICYNFIQKTATRLTNKQLGF